MPEPDAEGRFRVALVSMPFAAAHLPSIALTQLSAVLSQELGIRVEPEVHYLNHDYAQFLGRERYEQISQSVRATVTGLGDWLFRRIAFPEVEDNLEEYLRRYRSTLASEGALLDSLEALREGLEATTDLLIDRYELERYSLVGFTSMFTQNMASFAMARKIKERAPQITTVIGGANCETTMGSIIARDVDCIDFVFSGPGLLTFPKFVRCLLENRIEDCHALAGVYSRQKLERVPTRELNEIGAELDIETQIPLDYDDFLASLEQKCPDLAPSLLFETSRGCWWGERAHCTFCGLNGTTMSYRAMSPTNALAQFSRLFTYVPRVTRFESVDNIMPRPYLKHVFPEVQPPASVSIFYEVKADLKEREMQVLANAGVTEMQPGIEALSTTTLKLMRKGTTAFQNLTFLKNCLRFSIRPVWNLLIGFPGETEDIYRKYMADLPTLHHLPPPSGVYPVRFDRFSPYHTQAREYGLSLKPYDFYSLVYPFPSEHLASLAYFFEDQNYDNDYIALAAKWLVPLRKETERWNASWDGASMREPPYLEAQWRGDDRIIVDTRNGHRVNHDIGSLGFRVLEALNRPRDVDFVCEQLGGGDIAPLEKKLFALRELGLVFEEEDRFISLVTDSGRDQGYV